MDIPLRTFIPFRKRDIVEMLLSGGKLDEEGEKQFREFCELLQSVFHFDYHRKLESLKDAYAPQNPDRDTRKAAGIVEASSAGFSEQMGLLLEKANYQKLTDADLQKAFRENSMFKLRLHVDFEDFEEVLLFTRGEHQKTDQERRFFGLLKREVTFPNFDRVVLYINFRRDTELGNKAGSTMLKLFQNVPRADIEMLFPNTQLGMRLMDKLIIGVPAIAGGVVALSTKVGASLLLLGALLGYWLGLRAEPVELNQATALALVAGMAGLGSFIWKQFNNFRHRKLRFLQSLTENLYFKNLDNNAGVFHRLVDDAEEEECKEAILAYYFLLINRRACTGKELDRQIENWFLQDWNCQLDFEIVDALEKLENLQLISGSESLLARPLPQACKALDRRWDSYFTNNS